MRRKVALYLEDVQFHSRSQASSQSVEVMSLFPVRKLPEDSVKPVSQGQRNVPRQHNLCFPESCRCLSGKEGGEVTP